MEEGIPQWLKPIHSIGFSGATEVVHFQNVAVIEFVSSLEPVRMGQAFLRLERGAGRAS